jgi:hypothetical protein
VRPAYQDYHWWGGWPGLIKPDIVAPGPSTRSTTFPGNGYAAFSGTSAATPHVAGAMALCLQANPALGPEEVAMVLETTAHDLGTSGKDNLYGAGKLDCYAAVQAARDLNQTGTVRGTVTSSFDGQPIAGALVEVVGGVATTYTGSNGEYELVLSPAAYDLRFSFTNFLTQVVPVTVSAGGTATVNVVLNRNPAAVDEASQVLPFPRSLGQATPNPFGTSTSISFVLAGPGAITLSVFDVHGRFLRKLAAGAYSAGTHTAPWDGRDSEGVRVPSGVYLYRLSGGRSVITRNLVVLN